MYQCLRNLLIKEKKYNDKTLTLFSITIVLPKKTSDYNKIKYTMRANLSFIT